MERYLSLLLFIGLVFWGCEDKDDACPDIYAAVCGSDGVNYEIIPSAKFFFFYDLFDEKIMYNILMKIKISHKKCLTSGLHG